jgi:P pilus assembly chaperone PapD
MIQPFHKNHHTMKAVFLFFLAACLSVGAFKPLSAQVSIAPSTVFISDQTNIGTLYVSNRSDEPQEVSIEFAFGYPSSDADGNIVMNYEDSVAFSSHAINERIRAFPRSFVLGPRQQQTVRFQVRPQPGATDGVYWTRVKILANPQTPEIDMPSEDGIATRITFRFEQVIAAFYKQGGVTTGVNVKDVEVRHADARMMLLVHLERTGNAPFIGSMVAKMYDTGGNLVLERQTTTTAYFEEIRRIELDTEGIEPGNYRVELTFETRRGDISPTDLVQAPAITETVQVRIP